MNIKAGSRVVVFDPHLYLDDWRTPLTVTLQPATVLRRYKYWCRYGRCLEDVVDVRFDHDGRESKGHFTSGVEAMH
jgi:hypothetical protein